MEITICVFGAALVGKKTYVNRLITGAYSNNLQRFSHTVATSQGPITITYIVSREPTAGCNGYILLSDGNRPETILAYGDIPSYVVVAHNKCDGPTSTNPLSISAKWNKNLLEPVITIMRTFYGDITFTENVAVRPPVVQLVPVMTQQLQMN